MNNKIIRQLSSMQAEIQDVLEQKKDRWNNMIIAYKLAWKADDFYNHLPSDEQIEQISFAMFFAQVIGEISSVVMTHEAEFIKIAQSVINSIDAVEAEVSRAEKDLKPEIIKFGDAAVFKASRMYAAMQARENLRANAEISMDFARVMCDVAGANSIEGEGYQQYSKLYNTLAKFMQQPLRGYAEEDLFSMSLDELEYIDAQITVRERSERMAPFTLTYLEMVRKKITERIAFQKILLADDDLPND